MGEAAVDYYLLLARARTENARAIREVQSLVQRFPQDARYRKLLSDLGGPVSGTTQVAGAIAPPARVSTGNAGSPRKITSNGNRTVFRNEATIAQTIAPVVPPSPPIAPEPDNFQKGQALNEQGLAWIQSGQTEKGFEALQNAVALNPDYAWFRYDLATAYDDLATARHRETAHSILQEGRTLAPQSADMRFASALLANRQNQPEQALAYLNAIDKTEWTGAMSALERRISYGSHLDRLSALDNAGNYNQLAKAIADTPRWRAYEEVLAYERDLKTRLSPRVSASYENAEIAGTSGISQFNGLQIPLEIELPLDYEQSLFVRLDHFQAGAGTLKDLPDFADARGFGGFGIFTANELRTAANPADNLNAPQLAVTRSANNTIAPETLTLPTARFQQDYRGTLFGVGVKRGNLRADIGKPIGNFPVDSWVGGVQTRFSAGQAGSLTLDAARRMVSGSPLALVGATDPITQTTWGGSRRNGLSAVYYTPLPQARSFVGIGRLNYITGKNTPSNTELNVQGILSQTLLDTGSQQIEAGLSAFFWQFERNMRFYTYGQGGYYSPHVFFVAFVAPYLDRPPRRLVVAGAGVCGRQQLA
ncbi:MAG: hypothetical protein HC848_01840 [Limnobacter sp.]|nr:hypothetical protein [Limnobacter sp.]